MALESSKTSVFTFQSSIHSSHVLSCLDEQRRKDLLCDITVVVENCSFRAHRSVLASCSEYFSARMSSHTGQGLIVNLPPEVTAEGFEPLLQFAYTSKLLFTKENVLEIRSCAAVLGFKNLDKACFDFLLPKFFDNSKSSQTGQRKRCCKSLWRAKAELKLYAEKLTDAAAASSGPQTSHDAWEKRENEPNCSSTSTENITSSSSHMDTELEEESDVDYCCKKSSKFQLACKREQSYNEKENENSDKVSSLNNLPCSISDTETAVSTSNNNSAGFSDECAYTCPLVNQSLNLSSDQSPPKICPMMAFCALGRSNSPPLTDRDMDKSGFKSLESEDTTTEHINPNKEQRSSVEMEVANQLSTWHVYGSKTSLPSLLDNQCTALKNSEGHWPKQLDFPLLRDLGAVDAQLRGCEKMSLLDECPYSSPVISGDDSDSFDTDGESESGTSERASKMQLPFSLDRITLMTRNDFQIFLKTYQLTPDQLEYVHDVRRRSKNRIAARRCRKRKLDCIHNLECEIERLRSERETLTSEKQHLNQLKLKTWQSYSVLYERLCAEANLQPEQLQVFAKYTSLIDCPFSAHLSTKAHLYHHSEPELQPLAAGPSSKAGSSVSVSFSSSISTQNYSVHDLRSAEPPNREIGQGINPEPISKPDQS